MESASARPLNSRRAMAIVAVDKDGVTDVEPVRCNETSRKERDGLAYMYFLDRVQESATNKQERADIGS